VFANLGDGTYYHSGALAIRAAVRRESNITYKILFNDAVAMTGWPAARWPLTVRDRAAGARRGRASGGRRGDDPEKISGSGAAAREGRSPSRRSRRSAARAARVQGVSVSGLRADLRARRSGRAASAARSRSAERVVINELVCEGCGDCSVKSNCLSVMPLETEFGRKRAIDQSSCNKDYSCTKGFCPRSSRWKAARCARVSPGR
jgi:indolepyruvate ferredoxin oxidoreductase